MARIALVSAQAALALDEDMPPLVAALQDLGADVSTLSWDDPGTDWSSFDLALLRSTWDYVDRIDEFLRWAQACARVTTLLNPPDVVAWNTDKHYLVTLGAAGVDVVPTRFVEPGDDSREALDQFLRAGSRFPERGLRGGLRRFCREALRRRRIARRRALSPRRP